MDGKQVPRSSNGKIAAMIALHYLMLATGSECLTKPEAIEGTYRQRLHWWKAASGDPCWNRSTVGQEDRANKDQ
jgi:hypothetical protein